jgi:hypothetical protein
LVVERLEALPDLGQRQMLALELPDELEPIEVGAVVSRAGAAGAWRRQKPLLDVIPYRARRYARGCGELAEIERLDIGEHASIITV